MTQENKPDIRQLLETLEQNPDIRREFYQQLVKEVRSDPDLRKDLRKEILTEELLTLPARFTRLEETVEQIQQDIVVLKEGQARLEQNQARLERGQTRMSGQIANLEGNSYEIRAIEQSRRLIRNFLNMDEAHVIHPAYITSSRYTIEAFQKDILTPARRQGRITREQAHQLEESDAIIRCEDDLGNTIHAVVEISMTIQDSDRSRAFQRAAAFRQATGLETEAFVVGQREEQPGPDALAVTFLEYPG